MKVLIYGAGGHAQVVAGILLLMNSAGQDITPVAFIDDDVELHGNSYLDIPVLGGYEQIAVVIHEGIIVAVGDNKTRQRLFERLIAEGETMVTAVHPTAVIAPDVTIGVGSMVGAGVIVNTGSRIGVNTILNTGCRIDHHNHVGDHVHVAPGVISGGEVTIQTGALVGIGATIMPRKTIGKWAIVGAASLVQKDVLDSTIIIGVPGRPMSSKMNSNFTHGSTLEHLP